MKKTSRVMPVAPIAELLAHPIPGAVSSPVRSESDINQLLLKVKASIGDMHSGLSDRQDKLEEKIERVAVRNADIEQKLAGRRSAGEHGASMSWGETVVQSSGYKDFVSASCKGSQRIPVENALTSVGTSGGALVRPDRSPDGVLLPRRRLTIRALLGQGTTGSNLVEYFKEKTFVNNAAMVEETKQKPESELTYELASAPVRTIAHWVPASRQIMDDAPQLATLVDSSLRYGLALKEEEQFLFGDGQGQNLYGMMPQASEFDQSQVTAGVKNGWTRLDVLREAAGQAAAADLPASGIILNTRDFYSLLGLKDGEARYLVPVDTVDLWQLPFVYTNAMPRGKFLVGAFETATRIYDRMLPEVQISSEDRDNFVKNMLTIRGESRLAFAVTRPAALIKGDFDAILSVK